MGTALTPRQREIMDMVLAGHPNKNIAANLGISQRTVENHRALIMKNYAAFVAMTLSTGRRRDLGKLGP